MQHCCGRRRRKCTVVTKSMNEDREHSASVSKCGQMPMNYLKMMEQQDQEKIALIESGVPYTYGKLVSMAYAYADEKGLTLQKSMEGAKLYLIQESKILDQLVAFLACGAGERIPLILPNDWKDLPEEKEVPKGVCMAVTTSGSTGVPKILFRTYESWFDYFPIQNNVFGIAENSKLFVHGSLSFTGNLNLYMAQFSVGATVIAENGFWPKKWIEQMEQYEADTIYLIPSKLLCLPQVMKQPNTRVKNIISGSQSLGKKDAELLKTYFPNARIVLYYGASELNYISYVTDSEMTDERNLIGKPFPKVQIEVHDGEIYVTNRYHVEGIKCPYTLRDRGYMDDAGNLYFDGRSDDIVNIRGRKVSTYKIESSCNELIEIEESAVIRKMDGEREYLAAYLVPTKEEYKDARRLREKLSNKLAPFEIPGQMVFVEKLPKKESGKIDKEKLTRFDVF